MALSTGLRWGLTAFFSLVFVYGAIFNASVAWREVVRRQPHGPSVIVMISGLLGAVGVLLCPNHFVSRFFWLPPLLDYGCAPYLTGAMIYLIPYSWQHSKRNLLGSWAAVGSGGDTITVRMYKHGQCVTESVSANMTTVSLEGTWSVERGMLSLHIGDWLFQYRNRNGQLSDAASLAACDELEWLSSTEEMWLDGVSLHRETAA